jgi:hypothetical protein
VPVPQRGLCSRTILASPCVAYTLRSVLQDTPSGAIATTVLPFMRQTAQDLGVGLDVTLHAPANEGVTQMAEVIRAAVDPEAKVDALVVNVSSKAVRNAIHYVAENDMPLFGVTLDVVPADLGAELVKDESRCCS